jgi:hypothetical protein
MIAVGATASASGTADEVDTGDVVPGAVTLEVDATSGVIGEVSTTRWLAAVVSFASGLSVAVEDDADEFAAVDEEVLGFPVRCRAFVSLLVVSVPADVVALVCAPPVPPT